MAIRVRISGMISYEYDISMEDYEGLPEDERPKSEADIPAWEVKNLQGDATVLWESGTISDIKVEKL